MPEEMEINFFNSRTEKFLKSLDMQARSRSARAFQTLKIYGNNLGLPLSKSLGNGLFELRITGNIHIRFVYAFFENSIWMLHGFVKKTNAISMHDIAYARKQHKLLLHKHSG